MSLHQRNLIIMAKAPRIGRVKSRLARDIGAVNAWAFYRKPLSGVARRLAADGRWRVSLGVSPDVTQNEPRIWPACCPRLAQGLGDLGERMMRLMAVFAQGPVVLIGADIPTVRSHHIVAAFKLLGRYDAVFGPACDGGYWMVGLKHPNRFFNVFGGVRWSGPYALTDTIANLPTSWNYGLVATLGDVDDSNDLRTFECQAKTSKQQLVSFKV